MSGVVVVNQPNVRLVDINGNSLAIPDGYILTVENLGVLAAGSDGTNAQFIRVGTDGTVRTDPTGSTAQPITDNSGSITVDNAGTFAVQAAQSGAWAVKIQDGYGIPSIVDQYGLQTSSFISHKHIYIETTALTEGNKTLSDSVNWDTNRAFIESISVKTAALNWDLTLCETSAFDTALSTSRQLVDAGVGDTLIDVNLFYKSDSNNVYLIFTDTLTSATASFYITGHKILR